MKKTAFYIFLYACLVGCSKDKLETGSVSVAEGVALEGQQPDLLTSDNNAAQVQSGYSQGFQHGFSFRHSFYLAYNDFIRKVSLVTLDTGSPDNFTMLDIGLTALDTVNFVGNPNRVMKIGRSTQGVRIYLHTQETLKLYASAVEGLLANHASTSLFDNAFRIGIADGLTATLSTQIGRSLKIEGVTYHFDWGDDCAGCEPF